MTGDNVIKFPLRPSAQTLSLDLVDIQGRWIGIHLTPDDEVAVFVEHDGDAVGGLIDLDQARHFRAVQQHRDASFCHRDASFCHRDAGNRDIESAREHGATADWLERQREDRA